MGLRVCLMGLLVALAGLVTSCLDVEEEITLNQDGSGAYQQTIDLSEMMQMVEGLMGESEEGGSAQEMLGAMDSAMQENVAKLRQVGGIGKVHYQLEQYTYTLGYDFASIEALNAATAALAASGNEGLPGLNGKNSFSLDKRTLTRSAASVDDIFNEAGATEEDQQALEMAKMMLGNASMTTVYHLPGKVKNVDNQEASLSADGKTVTIEMSFLDLLEGNASLDSEIKFKKR